MAIQRPKTGEPLHHYAEIAILGLLHDHLRCMVKNPLNLLLLLLAVLASDFAMDAHIIPPHTRTHLTVGILYPCSFGKVMFHDRTVRSSQRDIV